MTKASSCTGLHPIGGPTTSSEYKYTFNHIPLYQLAGFIHLHILFRSSEQQIWSRLINSSYNMKKQITQVAEISVSYRPAIANKPIIKSPFDAYIVLREFFSDDTIQLNEKFMVMYLNKANRVLGVYPVSIGGITSAIVDLRLILSIALTTLATSIVLWT
jgi:DNA repair protein RadC